jgi:hypothetical protein
MEEGLDEDLIEEEECLEEGEGGEQLSKEENKVKIVGDDAV